MKPNLKRDVMIYALSTNNRILITYKFYKTHEILDADDFRRMEFCNAEKEKANEDYIRNFVLPMNYIFSHQYQTHQ